MSHPLRHRSRNLEARPGESLLDACLRQGVDLPFSCRGGVCQACLVRCTEGAVPEAAQKGLDRDLRQKGYLLACQCHPSGPMDFELPDPADRRTACILHDSRLEGAFLFLRFEAARQLSVKPGQLLRLRLPEGSLDLEVTLAEADGFTLEAVAACAQQTLPDWLRDGTFGQDFEVFGPLARPVPPAGQERKPPMPDPELWRELGEGPRMRAILEDFYQQVYADPRLAPFFEGVTMQRPIEKQFSFLKQLMTGESCYFGDRPRNAHHWMVISDELYDHRQAVMHRTLQAHGLTDCQMARWARLENHYRDDMVKDQAWPRRIGDLEVPLEGFATETLSEASLCDHCGQEVMAGTRVQYHLRLGRISCPDCSGSAHAPA